MPTTDRGSIAIPSVVAQSGGNRRTIGSVFIKRRCYTMLVGAMNATSFVGGTFVYTNWFTVEEFAELIIIGTIIGSGVATSPASGTWVVQINDAYNGNTGTPPYGWISHPTFATAAAFTPTGAATPSFYVPQFVGVVPSPFGDMVRVGVQVNTAWTGGGQLNIYSKVKV